MSPTEHRPHNAGVAGSSPAPATTVPPVPTSGYTSGGGIPTTTRETSGTPNGTPGISARHRRRIHQDGPTRNGYMSEARLAKRWGRSANTLVGWRTRPHQQMQPLEWHVLDDVYYYDFAFILEYEQGKVHSALRPVSMRGTPFPPVGYVTWEEFEATKPVVQAELPLPYSATRQALSAELQDADPEEAARRVDNILTMLDAGRSGAAVPAPEVRRFKSITISAGYALAIGSDDTAWYAEVIGGLQFAVWKPVAALPQHDPLLATIARRAA